MCRWNGSKQRICLLHAYSMGLQPSFSCSFFSLLGSELLKTGMAYVHVAMACSKFWQCNFQFSIIANLMKSWKWANPGNLRGANSACPTSSPLKLNQAQARCHLSLDLLIYSSDVPHHLLTDVVSTIPTEPTVRLIVSDSFQVTKTSNQ